MAERGLASPEVNTAGPDERSGGISGRGSSLLWKGRRSVAGTAPLSALLGGGTLVVAGAVLLGVVLVTR